MNVIMQYIILLCCYIFMIFVNLNIKLCTVAKDVIYRNCIQGGHLGSFQTGNVLGFEPKMICSMLPD